MMEGKWWEVYHPEDGVYFYSVVSHTLCEVEAMHDGAEVTLMDGFGARRPGEAEWMAFPTRKEAIEYLKEYINE